MNGRFTPGKTRLITYAGAASGTWEPASSRRNRHWLAPLPRPRQLYTVSDLVAGWSVDRLGRSLPDLLGTLDEIHAAGCNLYLHQQGLDTSTPSGRAMFQMMGVFAEFERAMIRERSMLLGSRKKAGEKPSVARAITTNTASTRLNACEQRDRHFEDRQDDRQRHGICSAHPC
jgi:DNA invertase Pin-like site-specific DNA recombinase